MMLAHATGAHSQSSDENAKCRNERGADSLGPQCELVLCPGPDQLTSTNRIDLRTVLSAEDASLVAMEYGLNPVVDEERSFDIYPE
jgi:hypothetical protein